MRPNNPYKPPENCCRPENSLIDNKIPKVADFIGMLLSSLSIPTYMAIIVVNDIHDRICREQLVEHDTYFALILSMAITIIGFLLSIFSARRIWSSGQ